MELGAEEIFVGLGGSATTDGGAGMAVALGYELLDKHRCALAPQPQNLPFVHRISRERVPSLPRIVAACDVENPLLGPRGTAQVFAPQKGASPATVVLLESALQHFSNVVQRELRVRFPRDAGGGRGGWARLRPAELCRAPRSARDSTSCPRRSTCRSRLAECDLVLTGEGRIDRQTLEGKGPAGVAALARAGRRAGAGLRRLHRGSPWSSPAVSMASARSSSGPMSLVEAMARGAELLERAAARTARLLRLGTLPLATSRSRVKG